jgi:nicotinate-nucleotide adenylyltransferase
VDRGGVRYTVDTLADIGARHPGARLYFILGADSLRDLPGWRDVPGILARCEIVTVARPGVEDAGLAAALDRLPSGLAARLRAHCIAGGDLDISSTDIRRRVAAGIDISALVPPAVAAYIAAHRLYVKETGP